MGASSESPEVPNGSESPSPSGLPDPADLPSAVAQRYLEAVARLARGGAPVPLTGIAHKVGVSVPTAHEMMGRLLEGGFVSRVGERGGWLLTDQGRYAAAAVKRRRSGVEYFLRSVLMLNDEGHFAAEA